MFIVLDRDGVINFDSDNYIKSPDEWIPIPGSIEAIAQLTKANYKIAIATNQSGVNRGLYSVDVLNQIHQKMLAAIEKAGGKIEKIYFCPHRPDEHCNCRKPEPGMLRDIMRDFQLKKEDIVYIGDSFKDWEMAQTVGCTFILVRTGNGEKTIMQLPSDNSSMICDDLMAAVKSL